MQSVIRQMDTPKIDPSSVIKFFDEEEERLRKELDSVVMAKETMRKLLHLNPEQTEYLEAPHIELAHRSPVSKTKKSAIPTEYKKSDTYGKKILYLLNKHGEATTPELTQYILDEEPELKPSLVSLNVGKNTTRLLENDKVDVEKIGNTNSFRLK